MSGDPEQEYFADGMVEEIITALSRIRWLFVIARNSTFTYSRVSLGLRRQPGGVWGDDEAAFEPHALLAIGRLCHLSSQTSSMRHPLKMLLTIRVSPFTCGCRHVPSRL
jgi:hypothetical protein